MQVTLWNDRPTSAHWAIRFAEERLLGKLRALDAKARRKGLEGLEAGRNPLIEIGMECDGAGRATKNGYGVFHLAWQEGRHGAWAEAARAEAAALRTGMKKLKYVVWAGMGGSAEDKAAYGAAGILKGGPRFFILDSTDPAKLKAILGEIEKKERGGLASTLVVGMAMGMTSYEPVLNLERLERLFRARGVEPGGHFAYLTLDGSLLDRFGSAKAMKRIGLQPDGGNATAGRHSAPMTMGSLLALALAGADVDAWLRGAVLDEAEIHNAWALASFLHVQGEAGREVVTLAASKSLAGLAVWTKQDFEESLGKSEELGVKVAIGEPLAMADYRAAKAEGQDRVFLVVERKGEPAVERNKLALWKRAGYGVAVVVLEKGAPISKYMQFMHYVVFGMAWLRRMNFVTQPSVELYKARAKRVYENGQFQGGVEKTEEWKRLRESVRQVKWRGGVTLHYDRMPCGVEAGGRDAAAAYASILKQFAAAGVVSYGELTLFGDTRYSAPGKAARRVLDKAAAEVFRGRLKMACDVYEGPAMNHSYHEMIIGRGRCFSTVILPLKAEGVEECGATADYHRAQFLATQMALEERVRLVVAVTVKDLGAASLSALEEFFKAVARRLRD